MGQRPKRIQDQNLDQHQDQKQRFNMQFPSTSKRKRGVCAAGTGGTLFDLRDQLLCSLRLPLPLSSSLPLELEAEASVLRLYLYHLPDQRERPQVLLLLVLRRNHIRLRFTF